ncbi:hypothetical protein XENOCAPTIV_021326 [Xenoophorus captivus]|uniref:BHLH domain-containing protein n=1 Tax=Xenoophorus captivus TaxID=1517983 RepID=A0ABV0QW30_9TELE
MVPVVSATPSVPPLPLTAPIGAAATSLSSPLPLKTESTSSTPQQQLATHHLLCPSQIKIEPAQQLIDVKPGLSQPQVQIQYPASIGTNGSGSHHALECFETLKKNVPNVDEKKTSNLSVLRSALRYIQVKLLFLLTTIKSAPVSFLCGAVNRCGIRVADQFRDGTVQQAWMDRSWKTA